jgi:hypothetical protein
MPNNYISASGSSSKRKRSDAKKPDVIKHKKKQDGDKLTLKPVKRCAYTSCNNALGQQIFKCRIANPTTGRSSCSFLKFCSDGCVMRHEAVKHARK